MISKGTKYDRTVTRGRRKSRLNKEGENKSGRKEVKDREKKKKNGD